MVSSLRLWSLTLLASSTLTLTDCSKSSDPAPAAQPSRTDLLTAHNWRLSAGTYVVTENGATTTTDLYARLDACAKDNFSKYNVDHSSFQDGGVIKCSPTEPQVLTTSTWALLTNDTELSVTANGSGATTYIYKITALTTTTLSILLTTTSQGKTDELSYTYVAI